MEKELSLIQKLLELHSPRKLKMLVANDDQFQLLIVRTALMKLPYVDQIDEASNG
jgi:hypothetical protein